MIDGMPGGRIVGLDLARFVAIMGMMATHVWLYADLATGEQVWFTRRIDAGDGGRRIQA